MPNSLRVVHVHVHVKPEHVEAFREATLANARESVKEPGVARFDVIQDSEDATRFVLVEVYRSAEAPAAHKDTAHYLRWRDAVAPMMAEPRTSRKYVNLFPEDAGW
ncbi:antibiotic biosynthesis monooxygenase [Myxococcus sp. K38C18041901]|uniref:putative quinol monooxygenase n=1 Tax=Myxococcus guangdongensis TaxID=2906760 RepID=UPI0020A7448D|nr:antibiotic biosynthesis monooxygenase [Myxococcus guangdongensis]MCP3062329.1 antibiotic biosynthesis monooxygenase [Myxococcus guangdongensis]